MWVIAKLSMKEILYKRIFHITVIMSVAFLVFYGFATRYASKEFNFSSVNDVLQANFFATQLLGIGLYFAAFITTLLAILCGVGSVSGEIESHQIDTVLARPVRRSEVIFGKYIGLGMLMVIYSGCLFLGVVGINQLIAAESLQVTVTVNQVLSAVITFVLQPLLILTLALLLSSITRTINSGIVLIILYGVSFIGGFIEQLASLLENTTLLNIGIASSLLFPIDPLFRQTTSFLFDAADNPLSVATQGLFASISAPSVWMMVYIFLYGTTALFWATRKFSKRDL